MVFSTDPRGPFKPLTEVELAFAEAKRKRLRHEPVTASLMDPPTKRLSSVPVHAEQPFVQKGRGKASIYTEEFMRDLFRRVTSNPPGWNGRRSA